MRHLTKLTGRTVVITGGASGIGAGLARKLDAVDARVAIIDVHPPSRPLREQVHFEQASVTDYTALERAISSIETRFGPPYMWINNAGTDLTGPVSDMSRENWAHILNVNLQGAIHAINLVYPGMVARGEGRIINIASGAGLLGFPFGAPYSASKAGLIGLSLALHGEARSHGVHVGVVCPGLVETPLLENGPALDGVNRTQFLADVPGARMGVDKAALVILRAALTNRAKTVFPFSHALGVWLMANVPGLASLIRARIARAYRKSNPI